MTTVYIQLFNIRHLFIYFFLFFPLLFLFGYFFFLVKVNVCGNDAEVFECVYVKRGCRLNGKFGKKIRRKNSVKWGKVFLELSRAFTDSQWCD